MNLSSYEPVTVVPDAMITVTTLTVSGLQLINAISCRYIPATIPVANVPHRVVAVEVIFDPNVPNPIQPYLCNSKLLQVLVVPSNWLKSVRPYQPAFVPSSLPGII